MIFPCATRAVADDSRPFTRDVVISQVILGFWLLVVPVFCCFCSSQCCVPVGFVFSLWAGLLLPRVWVSSPHASSSCGFPPAGFDRVRPCVRAAPAALSSAAPLTLLICPLSLFLFFMRRFHMLGVCLNRFTPVECPYALAVLNGFYFSFLLFAYSFLVFSSPLFGPSPCVY